MVHSAVAAVVKVSVVSGSDAVCEAEVGPVVLVARVQQPAQLLPQTPEAKRPSILELTLLNQQQNREWKQDRKREISARIST